MSSSRAEYMSATLSSLTFTNHNDSHLPEIEKIVALLLKYKASPNATRPTEKATPLHFMSRDKTVHIAALLITNGADQSLKDHHGDTPEDYANECQQFKTMIYLQTEKLLEPAVIPSSPTTHQNRPRH